MQAEEPELLIARGGSTTAEPRALARAAERGHVVRVRAGVYIDRPSWEALTIEQRHVVAMRAFAAVAARPPVFSHWSAAVLQGLPTLRTHLDRVHIAVADAAGRSLAGATAHLGPVAEDELVTVGGLLVTDPRRTVVDIALSSPFADGVVVADGALRLGMNRTLLQEAVAELGGRRGVQRARAVAAFARAEAESAAESRSRATMLRLGVRPPVLQFEVLDGWGLAGRLDFWFPHLRVGGEVEGARKYLELARSGAGQAVVEEKWREDRVRRSIAGLARWGWPESGSASRLGPILAASGIRPASPRATLADYCAVPSGSRV